ncbi:HAD family hydrolase [Neptunicella sp. SCSIO 80796]|uniref:HAD family hydrolase n=1 Tax=Neptunicella plasticusilytica TaxID=3117012 RepID=UPI003A4D96C7
MQQAISGKYKLVIFDWDGTLMDSTPKIVSSVQNAALRAGLTKPSDEQVNDIIGLSLRIGLDRIFALGNSPVMEQLVDLYRDEYLFSNQTPSPMFDGSLGLLDTLQQRQQIMAVATGKLRRGLDEVWQVTGAKHYFASSRCADEAESKPSPDMLLQLLSELGIDSQDAVMIGDTEHDMKMAEAIDMPRIGVSYGAQPPEKLHKHRPLTIVDRVDDLINWL